MLKLRLCLLRLLPLLRLLWLLQLAKKLRRLRLLPLLRLLRLLLQLAKTVARVATNVAMAMGPSSAGLLFGGAQVQKCPAVGSKAVFGFTCLFGRKVYSKVYSSEYTATQVAIF